MGKLFVLIGILFIALGVFVTISSKFQIPLGRLPGDILIQKGRFSFAFPVATCLIISLLLTLLLNLFRR